MRPVSVVRLRGVGMAMQLGLLLMIAACVESKTYQPPPPPPDPFVPTVPQLRLPQNNAYEGSLRAGKLRPTFGWEPAMVEEGEISYELQYSTDATFAAGVSSAKTAQTSYQPAAALPISESAPVGRRYFWRVRACVEEHCSEFSPPWRVNVGRSLKDFNGDGYDDVIVSSHASLDEVSNPGRAFVYLGNGGTSFNTSRVTTLRDFATESWFGYSVASAGDFNDDGFADVLIGAPKSDNTGNDAGRAYLYFGGDGMSLEMTPDVIFEGGAASHWFGGSVSSAGDVNSDGYGDVIIGAPDESGMYGRGRAYLYLGTKQPSPVGEAVAVLAGSPTGAAYAASVANAGDINGDGFADVLVSSSSYLQSDPAEICSADVFLGGGGAVFDDVRDGQLSGAAGEKCHFKAAGAGDVNRDGFSDVIARVSVRSDGARLFLGGKELPKTPDKVLNLPSGHRCQEAFGVGDLNGDGAADIAITDRVSSMQGNVLVHFGKPGAKSAVLEAIPAATLTRTSTYTLFGWAVRPAGDVNGDGFGDLILGDQAEGESAGAFFIYFGNGGAVLNDFADGVVTGGSPRTYVGYSVASLSFETRLRLRGRLL